MTVANERFSSELASHAHHEAHGEDHHGPGAKLVIVGYGFWIFLLSDIVMFSAFFAAHAVLQIQPTAGQREANYSRSAMSPMKPPVYCYLVSPAD